MSRCGYLNMLGSWIVEKCQHRKAHVLTHMLQEKSSWDKVSSSSATYWGAPKISRHIHSLAGFWTFLFPCSRKSIFVDSAISMLEGHSGSCQTRSFSLYFDNFCAAFWVPVMELKVKEWGKGRGYYRSECGYSQMTRFSTVWLSYSVFAVRKCFCIV